MRVEVTLCDNCQKDCGVEVYGSSVDESLDFCCHGCIHAWEKRNAPPLAGETLAEAVRVFQLGFVDPTTGRVEMVSQRAFAGVESLVAAINEVIKVCSHPLGVPVVLLESDPRFWCTPVDENNG